MRISDVLRVKGGQVVTVTPDTDVRHLLAVLAEHRIGAVVVSHDGTSVDGIASERDIVRALAERGATVMSEAITAIYTAEVHTVTPQAQIEEVMRIMTEHRVRRVPDPVLGHDAHDLLDLGLWRNRVHLGCVDSRDRLGHHRGASLGQRPDDVPLTGDSVDRGAVVRDDDGADPVFGEHREKVPHVGVRGDGDDLPALDTKYVADAHLALPDTGAALTVYPPAPPRLLLQPAVAGLMIGSGYRHCSGSGRATRIAAGRGEVSRERRV